VDVLTLLKEDHKTVGALLDEAKQCEPGDARLDTLAEEIEAALTVHAAIEEKYFYPALRDRAEESDEAVDVFEAYTEHELVKKLIELLKSGRQPDEQFKAEVQVLAENVTHHVKEEESTIFALAREVFDKEELEELGEEMEAAKTRMTSRSARRNGARKARGARTRQASRKKTTSRRS
jgi:hemerythrin superfamily protein